MNKKVNKTVYILFAFICFFCNVLIVKAEEISIRQLLMMSVLAYEDLPSSCQSSGNFVTTSDCIFTQSDIKGLDNETLSNLVTPSSLGSSKGQNYYFGTLGDVSEIKDWKIIGYSKIIDSSFSVYAFKNEDNIVFSFRGNKYLDVLEWGQDINKNVYDVYKSYEIISSVVSSIIRKNSSNNFYFTGYSLGGLVAQMVVAKLGSSCNYKGLEYFNSPGITVLNNIKGYEVLTETIEKLPEKLKSIGNIILYTIQGDVASSLGKHYGIIREYSIASQYNDDDDDSDESDDPLNNWISGIKSLVIGLNSQLTEETAEAVTSKKIFNIAKFIINLNSYTGELSTFTTTGYLAKRGDKETQIIKENITSAQEKNENMSKAEIIEIAHKPDSFLCIYEKNNITPSVEIRLENVNNSNIIYSKFNGENLPFRSRFIKKTWDNMILKAYVTSACAAEYQWYYAVYDKGSDETNWNIIDGATNSTYKIPDNNKTKDILYKVEVKFGNSFVEGTIDEEGNYSYETKKFIDNNSAKKAVFRYIYDATSPICYVSPGSLRVSVGRTKTVELRCLDNYGFTYDDFYSMPKASSGNLLGQISVTRSGPDYYIVHRYVISRKDVTFTWNKCYVQDYAGNCMQSDLTFIVYKN